MKTLKTVFVDNMQNCFLADAVDIMEVKTVTELRRALSDAQYTAKCMGGVTVYGIIETKTYSRIVSRFAS